MERFGQWGPRRNQDSTKDGTIGTNQHKTEVIEGDRLNIKYKFAIHGRRTALQKDGSGTIHKKCQARVTWVVFRFVLDPLFTTASYEYLNKIFVQSRGIQFVFKAKRDIY